jgi:hypothetical protein
MKKWNLTLLAVTTVFSLTSCLDLDNGTDYTLYYDVMATVTTAGTHPILQMDNGEYLSCETTMPADTFTVGERYYVNFSFADTTDHLSGIFPVLFSAYGKAFIQNYDVLSVGSIDRRYDQPIIGVTWASFSGQYLNMWFWAYLPTLESNAFDLVRIMENESNSPTDTVPELYFDFRHNVESVSSVSYYDYFMSYDLSALSAEFPAAIRYKVNLSWNSVSNSESSLSGYYTPNAPFSFQQYGMPKRLAINP